MTEQATADDDLALRISDDAAAMMGWPERRKPFDPNPAPGPNATSQERLRHLAASWEKTIPIRAAWLLKAATEIDALQARVKEMEAQR